MKRARALLVWIAEIALGVLMLRAVFLEVWSMAAFWLLALVFLELETWRAAWDARKPDAQTVVVDARHVVLSQELPDAPWHHNAADAEAMWQRIRARLASRGGVIS